MKDRGRPTKYNEALVEKARDYINVYETLGDVIPTIEGLALYLDISRETVYDWCTDEKKKDFSDTVKKVTLKQKQGLINGGLSNNLNAKITQLLLGANHSVIEKIASEVSGPSGKPQEHKWTVEFVEAKHEK
ncbi:hypothetical protein KAR91_09860 [Candidatus Pacearchaeota archaeon]|nr:hypothetical protein [Candidatus Pacearchaeota archaeon]